MAVEYWVKLPVFNEQTLGHIMREGIHPAYEEVKVNCSCGNSFTTRSTACADIAIEVCSECHPFFTGKQKLVDTAGRVDKFMRKYQTKQSDKKASD